ncbi:MAG: hypothetical protein ABI600_01930 [Luteolibacter sp.]
MTRRRSNSSIRTRESGSAEPAFVLPSLSTAEQIARVLQVTSRAVHAWAAAGTVPVAFRQGRIVRFNPLAVAKALGIDLPEFGVPVSDSAAPTPTTPADGAPPQVSQTQGSGQV